MERRDPYAELNSAMDMIAEGTFGAGQDPDQSIAEIRDFVTNRFWQKYIAAQKTMEQVIANNTRLVGSDGPRITTILDENGEVVERIIE